MALWMEPGSEPKTESELADLEAISALKESTALELKENGNAYVKKGKNHYSDAIDCYTRAINQKALSHQETSSLFANRAHVNLLLGNYRRALTDAQNALQLSPTNVKAYYRAAKASLSLKLLNEAKSFCESGLERDPHNQELMKLEKQINLQKTEHDERESKASKAVAKAKELFSEFEARELKIGKAVYRELTGLRKPVLDTNRILHWPVLLLYAEVMSSDFIEDFCETDSFSAHLDIMFSDCCEPLPWDQDKNYTREAIELYYEAGSGVRLSKKKVLEYLLEGTAGSNTETVGEEENDDSDVSTYANSAVCCNWVKVSEKRSLQDILKEADYIIPMIPGIVLIKQHLLFVQSFMLFLENPASTKSLNLENGRLHHKPLEAAALLAK